MQNAPVRKMVMVWLPGNKILVKRAQWLQHPTGIIDGSKV